MKRYKSLLFSAALVLFGLTACQTNPGPATTGDTGFLGYEGQQSGWPIEPSALVERDWALPVYRGLPPKPYHIVGRIISRQDNIIGRGLAEGLWSDRDRMANVVAQAQAHGADAVMLTVNSKIMETLHVPAGDEGRNDRPLYNFPGAVVAIKWAEPVQ